jgi:hypothetical protein
MINQTKTKQKNNEPAKSKEQMENEQIEKLELQSHISDALFRDLTEGALFTIGDSPIEFIITKDLGLYTKHANTLKLNPFKCRKFMLIRDSILNGSSSIYKTSGRWGTQYGTPVIQGFIQVKKPGSKNISKK